MISRKTFRFDVYRGTDPATFTVFRGGPVTFIATFDDSIDLTGCTSLRADIRASSTDTDAPLASSIISSPSGTEFSFSYSTAEMNHNLSEMWLVISAYYPEGAGDVDDNLDPLFIANLNVVLHNASLLAPQPPDVSVYPTGVFLKVAVAGQSDIVADSYTDTLTFAGGGFITLTTNASTDTVTIAADLTNLNATNLTSGTIPDARFPATLPAVSGANLTNLAAANITGNIARARINDALSANAAPGVFTTLNVSGVLTGQSDVFLQSDGPQIRNTGSGNLRIYGHTSGVGSVTLNETGGGYVGIGTALPLNLLHLVTGSNGGLSIQRSGQNAWGINSYNSTDLNFSEVGVADGRLYLKAGGNVGIGTTNPGSKLEVSGTTYLSGTVDIGGVLTLYSNILPAVDDAYTLGSVAKRWTSIHAGTGASTFAGNLGIGTTSPGRKLTIQTSLGSVNNGISFLDFDGTEKGTLSVESTVANDLLMASTSSIRFYSGSTIGNVTAFPTNERMVIKSDGNVGIGVVSPEEKLEVSGNIKLTSSGNKIADFNGNNLLNNTAGTLTLGTSSLNIGIVIQNGAEGDFSVKRNTTTDLFISAAGNVGIGITIPTAKLDLFDSSATNLHAMLQGEVSNTATGFQSVFGERLNAYSNNTSGGAVTYGGQFNVYDTSSGTASGNYNFAVSAVARQSGARPVSYLYGVEGASTIADSSGAVSFGKNFYSRSDIGASATMSDLRHFEASNAGGAGTLTTQYGLYIPDLTKGATNYSIYSGSAQSYFGGNVGIGITSTTSRLEVQGAAAANIAQFRDSGGTLKAYIGSTGQIVGNSGLYMVSGESYFTDKVGIGTASPTSSLHVVQSSSIAAAGVTGQYFKNTFTGANIAGNDNFGTIIENIVNTSSSVGNRSITGLYVPIIYNASSSGDGASLFFTASSMQSYNDSDALTLGTAIGVEGRAGSSRSGGTVTNAKAFSGALFAAGTITNGYIFYAADELGGSGTFTNQYGLYVESLTGATNNWAVYTAGTTKSYFGGNVGIGTAAPDKKLDVIGSGQVSVDWQVGNEVTWGSGAAYGLLTWDTGKAVIKGQSGKELRLGANGSEYVTITTTGNVGIGTASPTSKLEIVTAVGSVPSHSTHHALTLNSSTTAAVGVGPSLKFRGQTGNVTAEYSFAAIQGAKESAVADDYSGYLSFHTQGSGGANTIAEQMRITSAGNVGIGNSNPSAARLVVKGSGSTSASTGLIVEDSDGTDIFAVRNDGRVGAGKSTTLTSNAFYSSLSLGGDLSSAIVITNSAVAQTSVTAGIVSDIFFAGTAKYANATAGTFSSRNNNTHAENVIVGIVGSAFNNNAASRSFSLTGASLSVNSDSTGGTTTHAIAVKANINNNGSGTITNLYGLQIPDIANGGTITNTYGVCVGDITTGTQTNTPFSFYASDANAYNYFAGNVGIGTTSPTYRLDVYGAAGDVYARVTAGASNGHAGLIFNNTADPTNTWAIRRNNTSGSFSFVHSEGAFPGGTLSVPLIIDTSGNIGIGTTSPDTRLDINGALTMRELSADPADPDEGAHVVWQSDGTGVGDDGDIMMKITAGGVTKTITIVDFSAV